MTARVAGAGRRGRAGALRRPSARRLLGRAATYAFLLAVLVFAVFPFLWTLAISITDKGASGGVSIYDFPASLLPRRVTLRNFAEVFRTFDLARYLLNSVILSAMTVAGTLLVSALAAYPLAKMRFPLKRLLFGAIVATLVLPSEINFVVNTLTLKHLHLFGSYLGVVLPTVATAFGIFLMRQAFVTVPDALLEAARIDGASDWQILWRLMIPVTTPSLTALGIFTLVNSWNSYFWPMVALLSAPEKAPLSVAVLRLRGQFVFDPFNIAAGAMVMMLPVLLVFLLAQRLFMRGLEGAVK